MPVAQGSAEDGARAQQKIFDLIRGEAPKARGQPHEVVLTEAEINRFLSNPQADIRGTRMNFPGLRRAQDRANIIAWLRTQSANPVPLP